MMDNDYKIRVTKSTIISISGARRARNEGRSRNTSSERHHLGVGLLGGGVEFVHAADLDPLVEPRKSAHLDARLAEASLEDA